MYLNVCLQINFMMVGARAVRDHPLMRSPAQLREIGLVEPHTSLARTNTTPIPQHERTAEKAAMMSFGQIKEIIEIKKTLLGSDPDQDKLIRIAFALYLYETIELMYATVTQKNEVGLSAAFKTVREQVQNLLNDRDYYSKDVTELVGGFARNDEVFQACLILCDMERVPYPTAIFTIVDRITGQEV